jgi:hypothetical protein
LGLEGKKKSVEPSIFKPRQLKHVEMDEDFVDEEFIRYCNVR